MEINTLSPDQIREEMNNAKTVRRNYFNFQHRLANDDIRDVEVYSSPINLAGQKVLFSIVHDITERLRLKKEREEIITALEKAQHDIKALKGILPLCSFCKKIRDDAGKWEQVDSYIYKHSAADVSHTICPDCMRKHYPDFS